MKNLCLEYLRKTDGQLNSYLGFCDRLAEEVCDWAHQHGIEAKELMIARPNDKVLEPVNCVRVPKLHGIVRWVWHVVVEADGYIHDAWFPQILKRNAYLLINFGHHGDVEAWYKRQ